MHPRETNVKEFLGITPKMWTHQQQHTTGEQPRTHVHARVKANDPTTPLNTGLSVVLGFSRPRVRHTYTHEMRVMYATEAPRQVSLVHTPTSTHRSRWLVVD